MNFIYLKSSFITWMVYLDPTHWPAPSWLVSSIGRALHRYRRGHGFKFRTGLNFFQVLFQLLVSVVFIAAMISYIRFFTAVHIYDFHISTIIKSRRLALPSQPMRSKLKNCKTKLRRTQSLAVSCASGTFLVYQDWVLVKLTFVKFVLTN